MILEIKKYPDPILKRKSEKIGKMDFNAPEIKELILNLKETILVREDKVAGLAANQVGVLKKVLIVNKGKKNKLEAFLNPEIIKRSREKEADLEGCLSFPKIWLTIDRNSWVDIKAIDEEGREVIFRAEGFLARIFQHEIDHLDGIQFFERLGLWRRWKIKRKLDKIFSKK